MRYAPKHLIAVDPVEENLIWVREKLGPKAEALGITLYTITPEQAEGQLERITSGTMGDDVIAAVGRQDVQNRALSWAGFGGVVNLFGGLRKGESVLDLDNISVHYNEVKVVGSSGGGPHDYKETLEAIRKGEIETGKYVAAVGSLENIVEVLQLMESGAISGKAILYPQIDRAPLEFVRGWDKSKEQQYIHNHRK